MPSADPKATRRRPRSGDRRLRVAVVNDYEMIVASVQAMLAPHARRIHVVELDVEQDPEDRVDVALFDTYGQAELGLPRVRALAADDNVGGVAVYTWSLTRASRAAAYQAGAQGLIAKTLLADELVDSLEAMASGQVVDTGGFRGTGQGRWPGSQWGLSARQSEILALLATGMTNRAIAEALFVSDNTVRTHLKAVFRKLSVTNRSQAVARALTDPSFVTRQARRTKAD